MDKRGISGVVISILLVLISIAAIAIIGAFILAFIRTNTEKIESGINQVNIKIVENSLKYNPPELILKVKRNVGPGNLSGLSIIIAGENGKSATYKYDGSIEELETKQISVPISSFEPAVDKISKVSIAPITTVQSGNKYTGEVKDEEVPSSRFLGNNGLIGYWSFDNDQGNEIKDDSGNNNNGTNINGAISTNGRYGKAYDFNNVAYINITKTSNYTLFSTNQLTIAGWANPKVTADGWGPALFSDINNLGNAGVAMYFNAGGPTYVPGIRIEPNGDNTKNAYNESIYVGIWEHLVGTYDGTNIKLYINGTLLSSKTISINIPNSNLPNSQIGFIKSSFGSPHPFNGLLDEVRIYNRSLSATEIYYLYKYG